MNQKLAKRDKCESRLGIIEVPDVKDSIDVVATRIDVSGAPEARNRSLNRVNQNTHFGGASKPRKPLWRDMGGRGQRHAPNSSDLRLALTANPSIL